MLKLLYNKDREKEGDEINTKELRKCIKVQRPDFAQMLGLSVTGLYHRECGFTCWSLSDAKKICEIMREHGIEEPLTLSVDGQVCIVNISEKNRNN